MAEKQNDAKQTVDEQIAYWIKILVDTFGLTMRKDSEKIAESLRTQFVDRSAKGQPVVKTDQISTDQLRIWKRSIMDASMPARRRMRLAYAPNCYSKDDPITLLYEANYQLILMMLSAMMQNEDIAEKFLTEMYANGVNADNVDVLLTNEFSVLAHLQQMPEIAELQRNTPAIEDFNEAFPNNHRLADAKRKIRHQYHGKTIETISVETGGMPDENGDPTSIEIPDPNSNFAERIAEEMTVQQCMELLTEKEQAILRLRLENKTLEEIAKALDYYDASGVRKAIQKIGEKIKKAGILK